MMTENDPITIPIIDCSTIQGEFSDVEDDNYLNVTEPLGKAMSGLGFAYLINHGIDTLKVFFTLPIDVKRKYCKPDPLKSFHGYVPTGDEVCDAEKNSIELREAFDICGDDCNDPEKYPQEVPGFKEAFDDVRIELNNMGKKLLKCYGKYLKLEDNDFFVKRHLHLNDSTVSNQTQLRAIYYYPLNRNLAEMPKDTIRLGEHSDWGSITLLFQDMVGGLEVKTRSGEWIQAPPIKDAIILNNGNLMEFWTAGIYHAGIHRVKIPTPTGISLPRQSFANFISPDAKESIFPIIPVPSGQEGYLNQPPVLAGDYINVKFKELLNY